ncbi:uncharacterized protein LOC110440452 [Mizuhopecten yessoensis]|uniref:uncharacterized protein LOC110440452 n=1 Tax=Mizuhopecten yessoensis TaxID=6573 RepID=UPI000B4582E2|nr:uncharacterized protein LOC110440452 [Mizuhopecten yessoensis]
MDPGDQHLTLDDFITWKLPALRDFLTKRGLSKDGSKKELSALCFAVFTMKLPLVQTGACILKQNQEDYFKLLYEDDEYIPDPLLLHTGWVEEKLGLSKWPPIYITDIINFLVTRQSSTAVQTILNDYKIGKAYEYFQSGHLQEVYYHSISATSTNCILSAKCTPSQKVKDDSHTVWVCCCKESGTVKSAYCTCTAGLGSTCNHVAGLLFRVEAANKMGIASCTSVPCVWNYVPSGQKRVEPCQWKNMTIRKSRHGKAASVIYLQDSNAIEYTFEILIYIYRCAIDCTMY